MHSSIGVVVAHRRGDDELAALVVVGDDGGHVRHVAAVVLQVDAAAADHAGRVAHAHRRDQVRRLVDEQVGEHAAAERPVAAPLRRTRPGRTALLRRRPSGSPCTTRSWWPRNMSQSIVFGVMSLRQRVVAPLADDASCGSSCVWPWSDVADVAAPDAVVGRPPGRVGHRLHADGHDAVVLLPAHRRRRGPRRWSWSSAFRSRRPCRRRRRRWPSWRASGPAWRCRRRPRPCRSRMRR